MPNVAGIPLPSDAAGGIGSRLARMERDLQRQAVSRRMMSASIGEGGVRVKDQGSVTVEGGGSLIAWHENNEGYVWMYNGRVYMRRSDPEIAGYIAALTNNSGRTSMFFVPPYEPLAIPSGGATNPTRFVMEGPSEVNPGGYWIYSNDQGYIESKGTQWIYGLGGLQLRSPQTVMVGSDTGITLDSEGQIFLDSNTNSVFIKHTTGSGSANCILSTGGLVTRTTSARKYKQDIEDYTPDPEAVLALQPRTWRDRAEVQADPETETRYVGFIAEEVHEVLPEFVVYDEEGDPDALSYDRIAAAQQIVLQDQRKRIQELEATVARLVSIVEGTSKQ